MVLAKDYLGHALIGTPLERPSRVVREFTGIWRKWLHPELKEIYLEAQRMEQVIEKAVQDPMNCIDVGSHLGTMINIMARQSPNGKHIAVEPIPYKAEWLQRKYLQVEVLPVALSDETGEVDFFFQPNRSALGGMHPHSGNDAKTALEHIRVPCLRLDDIVPPERYIGFMKVVAEGAELGVLRGGEKIIARDRPVILFDCVISEMEKFGVVPQDFYDFLVNKHSYSLFLLKDWLADKQPITYETFEQAMRYPFQAFRFVADRQA